MAIDSAHLANTTSWDYIDIREAGFWGDAWNSVSSFGKGVVQGVEGVGKVVGDVATGNFSNVGKDVGKTFNSVGKDITQATDSAGKATGEGLHDVGKAAVDSARWVNDHKGEIAMGAAALGATVLAVGELGLNPAADALAVGVDTTVIGGETAAVGATEVAAAGTEEVAAAGTEEVAAAGTEEAGAEGVAGTPLKSALEKGLERAADGSVKTLSRGAPKILGEGEDTAASTSKFQQAKDLLNRIPGSGAVTKYGPAAAGAEAISSANSPDMSGVQGQIKDLQAAMTPAPQPLTPPQPTRQIDLNPTTPGAGTPGTPGSATPPAQAAPLAIQTTPTPPVAIPTGPAVLNTGQIALPDISTNVTVTASSKIIDLVEQFGLYPEDIKHSLTSWR